ncbi:MAG: phosphoenolpyruvate carboxykinase [Hyphomicrobiales bacterium]
MDWTSSVLKQAQKVHVNLNEASLYELALRRGEGIVANHGPLAVTTGIHTGRSAQDKYIVEDKATQNAVWWDNNKAMKPAAFDLLQADFAAHAKGKELFVQDLYGGADPNHRISVRVVSEFAWHALFIRHLLRRPSAQELKSFKPQLTIVNLPSFQASPERYSVRSETVIACNLSQGLILIGNSEYAGETKKSVFSTLNYYLPELDVLPMHCSANVGKDGKVALFFGLSGTGKTTLSSDPARTLIGDDEHGWSNEGVFNFEGGCYAKTIRLSAEAEPQIHATTRMWGSVLENVKVDPVTREPDFNDASLTENGRVAYPIESIPNASSTGVAGHPSAVIMLAADASGVLPPIARLTPAQAMYHFLSGYTAKVAGTEKGVQGTQATFSTCFGAPFMPRHPSVYGNLLKNNLLKHNSTCWLVNTGWTGGGFGTGERMPIRVTRALLSAALDGSLEKVQFRRDPYFGFDVPVAVPGVSPEILDPRSTWTDKAAYDAEAKRLVRLFMDNFTKFEKYVDPDVRGAGPKENIAAE